MDERRLSIDVWSDVICPWCFVGKRRMEAALSKFDHRDRVDVRWHAFELDPSSPRSVEGPAAARLARKYGTSIAGAEQMLDRMTLTGAADGLTFDFSRTRSGNTFDAHRLLRFAVEKGKQAELKERLMRGYFSEGEPIGEREALVKLAAEAGLDEEQARAVVFGDAYTADVRADEAQAASLGIRGVPFFIIDRRYALSGAQPPELILGALQKAWSSPAA